MTTAPSPVRWTPVTDYAVAHNFDVDEVITRIHDGTLNGLVLGARWYVLDDLVTLDIPDKTQPEHAGLRITCNRDGNRLTAGCDTVVELDLTYGDELRNVIGQFFGPDNVPPDGTDQRAVGRPGLDSRSLAPRRPARRPAGVAGGSGTRRPAPAVPTELNKLSGLSFREVDSHRTMAFPTQRTFHQHEGLIDGRTQRRLGPCGLLSRAAQFLRCWQRLLAETRQLTAVNVQVLYNNHFGENSFAALSGQKNRPQFDTATYPSLFDELCILGEPGQTSWDGAPGLPDWDNLKFWHFSERGNHPLVRMLLGFIWKQSDLQTVRHVLAGIRANEDALPKSGAVMWQFGRHLRNPLGEPIFDQHTSRSWLLLQRMDHWTDRQLFLSCFGRTGIPTTDSSLNNPKRLDGYLKWWESEIKERLPSLEDPRARANVVLWSDRLMFSLGKAAEARVRIAFTPAQ